MNKKKEKKVIKKVIYEGLGFPIVLLNVPMIKVQGQWAMDISYKKLFNIVLEDLINKPALLDASEIKFIRKYLEMTTTDFATLLGVTHPAILHWEKGRSHQSLSTDVFIRLFLADHLKQTDKLFRKTFNFVRTKLAEGTFESEQISIDAEKQLKIA
jgi:DNA-binding transcriptional regulator YiaG